MSSEAPSFQPSKVPEDLADALGVPVTVSFFIFGMYAIYAICWILGFLKLVMNWEQFGDRSVGMLLVFLFIPFGFVWPLLATPSGNKKYYSKSKQ